MDRRGSAIILVLVSMVLMSILAGSLLQLTRFERIPRSESNIEVVIASVVDEILIQATEDLLDDNGYFLNAGDAANGGADEPSDFPWTNRLIVGDRQPENNNGVAQTNVLGGRFDDTWLAAHMPDFGAAPGANTAYDTGTTGINNVDTTNGVWRKITSLTGMWVGGVGGSAEFTGVGTPTEHNVSNLANPLNSDTNINTTSNLLVDADGDGIGDSRWEWAPLRRVGATQYVMAVRIVDLSARLDVNVATGRFLNTTEPIAEASASRGDSPIELDGESFVLDIFGAGAQDEWREVLNYRLNGTSPNPADIIGPTDGTTYGDHISTTSGPSSRRTLWTDGASRVSNTLGRNGLNPGGGYNYVAFGTNDLFELLQGGGLNSTNSTTLEDLMPNFLRRNNGNENSYAAGSGTPPYAAVSDFWNNDPRKHITTHSGVSVAAKPYNTDLFRALKIDVNRAVETGDLTTLRNRINTVLTTNDPGWATAVGAPFPHLINTGGVADQLAANIADYIDSDNQVTTVNGKTGFEALPYITEIYTQRVYNGVIAPKTPIDPVNNEATWTQAGVQGYAIEIANPFARLVGGNWIGRPVSLEDVYISFDGGATTDELSVLAGETELEPGEVLYLYQNSDGDTGPNTATNSDLSAYYATVTASSPYTNIISEPGPALPTGAALTEITVSLHATAQGGTTPETTWTYNECTFKVGDDQLPTEDVPSADFTIGQAYQTYVQTSYQGVGEGLRMMTVANTGLTNGYSENTTSLDSPSSNTTTGLAGTGEPQRPVLGNFTDTSKPTGPAGFSTLNGQQIVWPDSDRERMHWIGDILQIPLIGPNSGAADETMAGSFLAAGSGSAALTGGINALLLPFDASTSISGGTQGTLNYPHTVMLMEHLTTHSPASDGVDGDGIAATESVASPNDNEVLVPGKLNINTAPYDTLVRLLPFPDIGTREAIAQMIIDRRESLRQESNYSMGLDDLPGIAYTPSLFQEITTLANGAATPSGTYTNLGTDGVDNVDLNGVRIDLNQHETALGTYVDPDQIADDREEQIMLAKWLTEMTDTRSDVFAAYIVVQGYPADNFSEGATESARLIVLFSRAGVDGTGDKAVEIGRYRIN